MSALPHEMASMPTPERTPDLFWENWGDKSGLNQGRFNLMWRDVSLHYDARLSQHNFEHASDVLWRGMDLADFCEQNGIEVNRKILIGGLLFHDAGHHLDQTIYGLATKEALAADIWARSAPAYEYNDEEIEAGKVLIAATEPGVELKEPFLIEQIIMLRSDLHNIGEDYDTEFTPTTLRLLEESLLLSEAADKHFNAGFFVLQSIGLLRNYLKNDLSLGEFDANNWQEQARANITKLVSSLTKEAHSIEKNIIDLGTTTVKKVLGGSV